MCLLLSAFKPRLLLVRIAMVLCFLMIILCVALIVYDILVEIDPTRCFFLDCSAATINASNSTTNIIISGWPVTISWPAAFQTSMDAKRIFQGIQIALGVLYILFAALYILTCFIYRKVNLYRKPIYSADSRRTGNHDAIATPSKHSNHVVSQSNSNGHITTYMVMGERATSTKYHHSASVTSAPAQTVLQNVVPRKTTKPKSAVRPRTSSVNVSRICTRCLQEPRMVLTTGYERANYFSHLCASCNNEMVTYRRKGTGRISTSQQWKP